MKDEDVKESSQHGRDFIAVLIERIGSDVSAVVTEKAGEPVDGKFRKLQPPGGFIITA